MQSISFNSILVIKCLKETLVSWFIKDSSYFAKENRKATLSVSRISIFLNTDDSQIWPANVI